MGVVDNDDQGTYEAVQDICDETNQVTSKTLKKKDINKGL